MTYYTGGYPLPETDPPQPYVLPEQPAATTGNLVERRTRNKKLNGWVDARADFAATGDGTTDDTEALQAWCAALVDGMRGVLPAGRYRVTDNLTLDADHVDLVGYGAVIVQDYESVGAKPVIYITGDYVTVTGVEVEGPDDATVYDALYSTFTAGTVQLNYAAITTIGDYTTVRDVAVTGKICGVATAVNTDAVIENVRFIGFGASPPSNPLNYHNAVYVKDSDEPAVSLVHARECGSGVLVVSSAVGGSITGCKIFDTHDNGIYISSGFGWTVSANRIKGSDGHGIKARGSNNTVTGNAVANCLVGIGLTSVESVQVESVYGGQGAIVVGNNVYNCEAGGIRVQGITGYPYRDAMIASNVVINAVFGGSSAASILLIADHGIVTGNVIYLDDSSVAAIQAVGDTDLPNPVGVSVLNNEIDDTATDGIRVDSLVGAQVSGNRGHRIGSNEFINIGSVTNSDFIGNRTDDGRLKENAASSGNLFVNNTGSTNHSLSGTSPRAVQTGYGDQWALRDGVVGAPALTFASDPDMGIYRVGTDDMALVSAGATVMRIRTAEITIPNGVNFGLGTGSGTKFGLGATAKLGFYGKTPVAQQTGVAVDAAGIHAALVALGLITA